MRTEIKKDREEYTARTHPQQPRQTDSTRTRRRGFSVPEIFRGVVGVLAASQGFGTVGARSAGLHNALALPTNPGLLGNATGPSYLPLSAPAQTHLLEVEEASSRKLLSGSMSTYVTNLSSLTIIASTDYKCFGGTQCSPPHDFSNKEIGPGKSAQDRYCPVQPNKAACGVPAIAVTLKVKGACFGNTVLVAPDNSVVAKPTPDGKGLDIFVTVHGTSSQPSGNALLQIYDNC